MVDLRLPTLSSSVGELDPFRRPPVRRERASPRRGWVNEPAEREIA